MAPDKIARVLDWVEARHDIDTTRVYVIGMSLGGYGTLDFAGTYPDRVPQPWPCAGAGTLKDFGWARDAYRCGFCTAQPTGPCP